LDIDTTFDVNYATVSRLLPSGTWWNPNWCANCGNRTFLTRRSPAASYALELERQTFTCLECRKDFERVVDADGKAVRSTAIEALARNRDATLSSKADGGDSMPKRLSGS